MNDKQRTRAIKWFESRRNLATMPGTAEMCKLAVEALASNALIESLQAQLAAYQKYGEPCDWRNAQADEKEIARLKAENFDIAKHLVESQRREQAAVKDIEKMMRICEKGSCHFCANGDCTESPYCTPKWRGPQEAGKGEAE